MPIYDYKCEGCGIIEICHPMTALVPDECPTCGKHIERVFGYSGVHFKGTGFYETDYKKKEEIKKDDKSKPGKQ